MEKLGQLPGGSMDWIRCGFCSHVHCCSPYEQQHWCAMNALRPKSYGLIKNGGMHGSKSIHDLSQGLSFNQSLPVLRTKILLNIWVEFTKMTVKVM